MTTIGLFEAKTKLSELCEQVARRRQPVVITRRGRPLVRIEPVGPGKGMSSSVWDSRDAWEKQHGALREEFQRHTRGLQQIIYLLGIQCMRLTRLDHKSVAPRM